MGDFDAPALARALIRLVDETRHRVGTGTRSALVERITAHIGAPLGEIPNIALSLPSWEHVTLHTAAVAYVAAHSPDAAWFGVGGSGRGHHDLMDMITGADQHGMFQLGAVDYTTLATGPDTVVDAVQLGFVPTVAPDGSAVVLGVRGGVAQYGLPTCELRVLARDRATATAVRDEVERLGREHDVFRGHVLSFDVNEHQGNELVSFVPRPDLGSADVVLPDGVLDTIERHVVRSAHDTSRLVELGQHLKRGLLLHGRHRQDPHRALPDRQAERIDGGGALGARDAAAPAGDGDGAAAATVGAGDRGRRPHRPGPRGMHEASPLLFELLNRIDGVDADADVTFVLTTNRVADMERALVDRPGRVDLAIEVPRPDAAARERLLRLYARDLPLELSPGDEVITATDGVTASFVRELVRRAVLRSLAADPDAPVVLSGELLSSTLAELSGEHAALTRSLLGG